VTLTMSEKLKLWKCGTNFPTVMVLYPEQCVLEHAAMSWCFRKAIAHLHNANVTAWCALSSQRIIGPYFWRWKRRYRYCQPATISRGGRFADFAPLKHCRGISFQMQ